MNKDNLEPKTLRADEATIQERQVSVRVLTIGTKQVTQALYRQLVVESVIYRHSLQGKVWGWVNIHGEKLYGYHNCEEDKNHIHVIWEDNGQLKRCTIHRRLSSTGFKLTLSSHEEQMRDQMFEAIKDAGQLFIAVSGVWK